VRFTANGDDRTLVELEHRPIERHRPGWPALRDGVNDDQGWPLYLAGTPRSSTLKPRDA
jgi:hypothetical protein